jgi:hypothetical protein
LGASANRKPVPVVSPNSHDRAILHHRYDWSVAVINRVQFENHGPARLGPGNVPAVPCRLIKGVELRFPNWMRFSYINQNVSFARRRVIHVQRVAALRDLISAV